jgi:hypothetical protein
LLRAIKPKIQLLGEVVVLAIGAYEFITVLNGPMVYELFAQRLIGISRVGIEEALRFRDKFVDDGLCYHAGCR